MGNLLLKELRELQTKHNKVTIWNTISKIVMRVGLVSLIILWVSSLINIIYLIKQ